MAMKIGLALSGGGFRAGVFHLGVLGRLAEENLLEDVALVSTVSGGSLCTGLVYANSGFAWPRSEHLIEQVIPKVRQLLTTQDLQSELLWRALRSPLNVFKARANYLSSLLYQRWGVTAKLCNLPGYPRWLINATTYETGKNWRFESFRMGDHDFGYTYDTDTPLSDALAASAGFPGLIGALEFETNRYRWFKYADAAPAADELPIPQSDLQRKTRPAEPRYSKVHLWDGGVYDNLGTESVFDFKTGWGRGVDFLIVSDASGKAKAEDYHPGVRALLRIITGIMMDQVRSLRTRALLDRMINHRAPGAFFVMGHSCEQVLNAAGRPEEAAQFKTQCLDPKQATYAAEIPTAIGRLSPADFELLFRHGYEVADYTLHGYYPNDHPFIGYRNSRSASVFGPSSAKA